MGEYEGPLESLALLSLSSPVWNCVTKKVAGKQSSKQASKQATISVEEVMAPGKGIKKSSASLASDFLAEYGVWRATTLVGHPFRQGK